MKIYEEKGKIKFTLTKEDFDFQYFPAGGHGGQKGNKTSSACRCVHQPSGSSGISRDERSQAQNKKLAFSRCVETKEFKFWAKNFLTKLEMQKSEQPSIEEQVEKEMSPENLRVETKNENEQWEENKEV